MRRMRDAERALRKRNVIGDDEGAIAMCCFIPLSMWKADTDMKGVIHPSYSFEETKRGNNARKVLLIESAGELLARVDSRCSSYAFLTGRIGHPLENAYVEWIQGCSMSGSMMFIPYRVAPCSLNGRR